MRPAVQRAMTGSIVARLDRSFPALETLTGISGLRNQAVVRRRRRLVLCLDRPGPQTRASSLTTDRRDILPAPFRSDESLLGRYHVSRDSRRCRKSLIGNRGEVLEWLNRADC